MSVENNNVINTFGLKLILIYLMRYAAGAVAAGRTVGTAIKYNLAHIDKKKKYNIL